MKFLMLSILSLLFISMSSFAQSKQYVEVTSPFVNVYKDLDPRSMVLGTVKKGDHLELIATGNSWYRVKVGNNEGWLEKRAGDITNNAGQSSAGIVIVVLVFLAAAFSTVAYIIYKTKLNSSVSS